jgi:hypothetical protein
MAEFVIVGEDLRFGMEEDRAKQRFKYDLATNLRCIEIPKIVPVTKKRESR